MRSLPLLLFISFFFSLFSFLYFNGHYSLFQSDLSRYPLGYTAFRSVLIGSCHIIEFFIIFRFLPYLINTRHYNTDFFTLSLVTGLFLWSTLLFYSSFLFGIALTPVIETFKISGSSEDMLLFLNKIPVWVILVDICLLLILMSWICVKRKKNIITSELNNYSNGALARLAGKYSSYYACLLLLVQLILFIFFKNIMTSPFYFFIYIATFLLILTVSVSFIRNSTKTIEPFLKLVYLCLLMPSFFVTLLLGIYSRLFFDAKYFELSGKHLLTDFELIFAKFITNPPSYFLIFALSIILISFLVMLIFKKKEIVVPLQLVALMSLFLYLCQKDSFISFLYSVRNEIEVNVVFWMSVAVPIIYILPFYFSFQKNGSQINPHNNSNVGEILSSESKIIYWFRKIIYWLKKVVNRLENVLFFLTLLIANFVAFTFGILWNSSFFYIFLVKY